MAGWYRSAIVFTRISSPRLLDRDARLQRAMTVLLCMLPNAALHRRNESDEERGGPSVVRGPRRKLEALRHDADDRIRLTVECDGAPVDGSRPKARQRPWLSTTTFAFPVLVRRKGAAELGDAPAVKISGDTRAASSRRAP
jgi:hypothetical protein